MELQLFNTRNEFDRMVLDVNRVFEALPQLAEEYLRALDYIQDLQLKWKDTIETQERLTSEVEQLTKRNVELEQILANARKKLEDEMVKNKRFHEDAKKYRDQLKQVREVLDESSVADNDSVCARLSFLKWCGDYEPDRLDTIEEAETTGSVITDLSYTREEDELLNDSGPSRRNKRPLHEEKENKDPGGKRRRATTFKSLEVKNGERVVATTTVTLEANGPCTASSTIENIPTSPVGIRTNPRMRQGHYSQESLFATPTNSKEGFPIKKPSSTTSLPSQLQLSPFTMNSVNSRLHHFIQKAVLKGDPCNTCHKRLLFSTLAFKCKNCKALVHTQCREKAPLPCVPVACTPSKVNKEGGEIADFTPFTSPMVPALVIHCIREVEARGMNELGLYRIPGSDKEVKSLKEKFLKGRGAPNLSEVPDIHAVCGTLKEFLRFLKEPIVTAIRWSDFVRAAGIADLDDRRARLSEIIRDLPQPNRDTLSYILLHLQRVANSPDCKMGIDNLAIVFGQTIVGVSKKDTADPYGESKLAIKVMTELLLLPGEYYESFISQSDVYEDTLPKTPSTHSLKYFMDSPFTVRPLRGNVFETP